LPSSLSRLQAKIDSELRPNSFTRSILSHPPLNPPFSWLMITFSPLSSAIVQYAPALGSVTQRPTLPIAASLSEME
jgi:hypothetical protein